MRARGEVRGMIMQRHDKIIALHTMHEYLREHFKLGLRGFHTWPKLDQDAQDDQEEDEDGEEMQVSHRCLLPNMNLVGVHPVRCIFVGEAAFDVCHRRRFAKGNEKDLIPAREKKAPTPRMKVIIAISGRRLVCMKENYRKGPTTDDDVLCFLRDLIAQMTKAEMYDGWHIVFNAVSETTRKAIEQTFKGHEYTPIFLPRCSFTHNPIYSVLKEAVVTMPRTLLHPKEKKTPGKKKDNQTPTNKISDETLDNRMKTALLKVSTHLIQAYARGTFSVACDKY